MQKANAHIAELMRMPRVRHVYAGTMITGQYFDKLYDTDHGSGDAALFIEANEPVFVTERVDGTWNLHYLSILPGQYHYITLFFHKDQATYEETPLED